MTDARQVRVGALAKINLGLEVLGRNETGFHDIRTIFQTISLADAMEIAFTPARKSSVETLSDPLIPNNLAARAAELLMQTAGIHGRVRIKLKKNIPLGGGLGGGSSDAAAVLLALPVLAGRRLGLDELIGLGSQIGSDVPFFLIGGCALGLGRGTDLYALEGPGTLEAVVVTPAVHVSTADAYRALKRPLTSAYVSPKINISRYLSLGLGGGLSGGDWQTGCQNDFEEVVFRQHPELQKIKRKLVRLGARPALLSGSGASIFGIFETKDERDLALDSLDNTAHAVKTVGRKQYQRLWWRQLSEHMQEETWPPQSRYGR